MILIIELSNYKDVDAESAPYVTKFQTLYDAGKYAEAQKYYEQNIKILKPRIVNAECFNKIERDINNTQKQILYTQKVVLDPNEPDVDAYQLRENSEWYQEY